MPNCSRELDESTDTATDLIAQGAADYTNQGGADPGWRSTRSPDWSSTRKDFPGEDEPMNTVGRGAVYTRTCKGTLLRPEPAPDANT